MIPKNTFFNSFWSELKKKGWPAVILHSWKELPEKIKSDIDYAVSGAKSAELLQFLFYFGKKHGWRLVQVIEHEPGAYFCVCQQAGAPFDYLQLDVCWEYRREGHRLLENQFLFKDIRAIPGKQFQVPSPGVELCYILAKAVAKRKGLDAVQERCVELIESSPEECAGALKDAFGFTGKAEKTVSLDELRELYASAARFRAVHKGRRFGFEEWLLYLRRIIRPTGIVLDSPYEFNSPEFAQWFKVVGVPFRKVVLARSLPRAFFKLRYYFDLIRTRLVVRPLASQGAGRSVEEEISRSLDIMAARQEKRLKR